MLKIFIGVLIIYISPIYIVETPNVSSYIINFLGTSLLYEGCVSLFSYKKLIKVFRTVYFTTLLVLIYQFIVDFFKIEITEITSIIAQLLLSFLPLLLVHISLIFIKDIDSHILITNKLILRNLSIILLLFCIIILNLLAININSIAFILLIVLKIFTLLGFYKLVIYYSP